MPQNEFQTITRQCNLFTDTDSFYQYSIKVYPN